SGTPDGTGERGSELEVANGLGCHGVEGPDQATVGDAGAYRLEGVGVRDPAHPLATGAEAGAESETEGGEHQGQCTATTVEHHPGAGVDYPNARVRRGPGGRLPGDAYAREKVVTWGMVFAEDLVTGIPVVVDPGDADEDLRGVVQGGER